MESLPGYVSIVFILTTFLTVGFLLQSVKFAGLQTTASKLLLFLLPLWIFFQAVIAIGGFYQKTDSLPPRLVLFGVLPTILLIGVYFVFFRESFIERLPLKLLTLLHVVRIPVELTLFWLFVGGQIPQVMTFEGRNFDILSGILAIIAYFVGFRGGTVNRGVLLGFNIIGLLLLVNIVAIAILSLPTPMQQIAFDQPNWAFLFFP